MNSTLAFSGVIAITPGRAVADSGAGLRASAAGSRGGLLPISSVWHPITPIAIGSKHAQTFHGFAFMLSLHV